MTSQSSTPVSTVPSYRWTPSLAADGDYDLCEFWAMGTTLKWSGIVVIILSVFNILGNISLVATILGNRHLWVRPNVLLANLCVTNILYFLSWSLHYVEFQLHPCWQFGAAVCKLTHACKYLSLAAYGFFMVALSFERFCAITNRLQSPRSLFLLIITWFLAFIVCLPVFILAHMPSDFTCLHIPSREPSGQAYVTAVFVITFAIPTLISVSLYGLMTGILFAGNPKATGGQYPGTREFHARKRMALVILCLLVFFTITMFVYHVYELSYQFRSLTTLTHFDFFRQLHHVSAYANFCICPWIVFATSNPHRDAFFILVLCKSRSRPKLYSSPETTENQIVDADSTVNSMFTEIPSNGEPAESDVL